MASCFAFFAFNLYTSEIYGTARKDLRLASSLEDASSLCV